MAPAFQPGLSRSYKFNPGFQTDSEAISGFVVRRSELDTILETLLINSVAHKPSHVLVTAPRGSGKTTLVRRVLAEVRTNEALSRSWFPIFLAEESYTITTPGEFFLECLFHLQDQLKDRDWRRAYSEAESENSEASLAKTALSALNRFAKEQGKRLLILVENFHMILNEQIGKEAQELQKMIDAEAVFMVLATSVRDATDTESGYASVLADYRVIPLQPLSLIECQQLWESLTHQDVKPERIRPLQILTGGSPRLIRIMAEFTVTPSLQNLLENLNQLIDQNTEYFKSQLDSLPPTERKVFAALLDRWDPCTAKEVAESSRVNVNVASAMLGRLSDRGAVVKLPGKGRSATYHAAERLFNIYYLMRRRSHPSSRVRALVAFMTQYYRGDELIDTTAKLVAEACALTPQKRADYHTTFNAIIAQSSDEIREKILSQTPKDFLASIVGTDEFGGGHIGNGSRGSSKSSTTRPSAAANNYSDQSTERAQFLAAIRAAVERKDDDTIDRLVSEALQTGEHSAEVWLELSLSLYSTDHSANAIQAVRRAIVLSPQESMPHALLATLLEEDPENTEEVKVHLAHALKYDAENPLALILAGDIEHGEDNFEGALSYYRRAWTAAPDFEVALTNLASMLGEHLGRFVEAELLLRDGVLNHPKWEKARHELARALAFQNKSSEAEQILRDGLALDDQSPSRWANLGQFLYWRLHDYDGAKAALHRAIELGAADRGSVWSTYGLALQKSGGSTDDALNAVNRGIKLEPEKTTSWLALGEVSSLREELSVAESAYRSAIKVDDTSTSSWFELGMLLQKIPGRANEAEQSLRNALASSEEFPCAVPKELAALLIHRGNDKEAVELLKKAVESNKQCYCSLTLLAGVASRHRDSSAAAGYFKNALKVNPDGITAMTGLAQLYIEQGTNLGDAKVLIRKALKSDPDDARVFLARALLNKVDVSPAECVADLKRALKKDPALLEAKLILALVEAGEGNLDDALLHLADAMRGLGQRREILSGVVDVAVLLAQRGMAGAVLDAIRKVEAAEYLEPLCVALELSLGGKPLVAKEVLEVANDIHGRIANLAR